MGHPAWADDASLDSAAGRVERCAAMDEHIAAWTGELDAVEVMERCQAAGVPAGVVQSGIDLLENDPQLAALGFEMCLVEDSPELGSVYGDRLPIQFEKTPCETYRPTQPVGADNVQVLADWLDMAEADVRRGEEDGYFT